MIQCHKAQHAICMTVGVCLMTVCWFCIKPSPSPYEALITPQEELIAQELGRCRRQCFVQTCFSKTKHACGRDTIKKSQQHVPSVSGVPTCGQHKPNILNTFPRDAGCMKGRQCSPRVTKENICLKKNGGDKELQGSGDPTTVCATSKNRRPTAVSPSVCWIDAKPSVDQQEDSLRLKNEQMGSGNRVTRMRSDNGSCGALAMCALKTF